MTTQEPTLWAGKQIPIIGVTGPKGSGKTLFAAAIDPERTLNIDCELSAASYTGIPYKRRVDIFDELLKAGKTSPRPLDAFLIWKATLENIGQGEFTCIITDTWDFLQSGLFEWIEQNPQLFNRTAGQYAKMHAMVIGDAKAWLHMFSCMVAKKCNNGSVVFINHEGVEFGRDGKPSGNTRTKGLDTIYQIASLYLVLEKKVDDKGRIPELPAAYTTHIRRGKSRLVHEKFENGKLVMQQVLPARIPECTPDAIRQYIQKPADWMKPKKGEVVEPETLTDDERLQLQARISENEREVEEMKLERAGVLVDAASRQRQASETPPPATVATTTDSTVEPTASEKSLEPAPAPAPATATAPPPDDPPTDAATVPPVVPPEKHVAIPVREAIRQQFEILIRNGASEDDVKAIISKRHKPNGATCLTLEDLSDEQAEDMRAKLWDFLTKKDLLPE